MSKFNNLMKVKNNNFLINLNLLFRNYNKIHNKFLNNNYKTNNKMEISNHINHNNKCSQSNFRKMK